jgi:predicted glycogen debranching enzyme
LTIQLGRQITGDLRQVSRREWLVTNGKGGYATGTLAGSRTRRYHGLLVASMDPPAKRHLLLAAVDSWVEVNGRRIPLVTHEWAAGVVLPDGYNNLEQFRLEGSIPVFRWGVGFVSLEQRIWMGHLQNTTYVTWHYTRGIHPVYLILKPLISYRSHHDVSKGGKDVVLNVIPSPWGGEGVGLDILPSEYLGNDLALAELPTPFKLYVSNGTLNLDSEWWWSFRLSAETERGMEDQEDLYKVATITAVLNPGETLAMVCTAENNAPEEWEMALKKEKERQQVLIQQAEVDDSPYWIKQLVLAADQFVIEHCYEDKPARNIVAGYPWFGLWGRSAMIGMMGLTLAVGRTEIAAGILRSFARHTSAGLIPNQFSDKTMEPAYNTVDATLWFIVACWSYMREHPDDLDFLREIYPKLMEIVEWHYKGTRYHIVVDPTDGLLYAGESDVQLTWMDVKIRGLVWTPRTGKAVEVNALWYNVLRIMEQFSRQLNRERDMLYFNQQARRVEESFNARYWYQEGGYLYDVIDMPDDNQPNDTRLRPNQLLALSLPFRLLKDDERARRVIDICAHELLVSHGLRSLGRQEKGYQSRYQGQLEDRDRAYHQGVVWGWLLGPFISAHFAVYQDVEAAMSLLSPMIDHLEDYGIGTAGEIFDADSPFTPRGAVAYATTVAELLRVWHELERFGKKSKSKR